MPLKLKFNDKTTTARKPQRILSTFHIFHTWLVIRKKFRSPRCGYSLVIHKKFRSPGRGFSSTSVSTVGSPLGIGGLFKRMLFIRIKRNMRMFRVVPFIKLQNVAKQQLNWGGWGVGGGTRWRDKPLICFCSVRGLEASCFVSLDLALGCWQTLLLWITGGMCLFCQGGWRQCPVPL